MGVPFTIVGSVSAVTDAVNVSTAAEAEIETVDAKANTISFLFKFTIEFLKLVKCVAQFGKAHLNFKNYIGNS